MERHGRKAGKERKEEEKRGEREERKRKGEKRKILAVYCACGEAR